LFKQKLQYEYLGNLEERESNSNIEEQSFANFCRPSTAMHSSAKLFFALKKEANINSTENLYTANKEVYSMLRYGTSKK